MYNILFYKKFTTLTRTQTCNTQYLISITYIKLVHIQKEF